MPLNTNSWKSLAVGLLLVFGLTWAAPALAQSTATLVPGTPALGIGSFDLDIRSHVAGQIGPLELQPVWDARVEKHLDRREGDHNALGNAVERQLNLELFLAHAQVPEAVLQNDRHFFGIFFLQPR